MINAILKGFISLISKLASVILSPVITFITALIPDLSSAITYVFSYLSLCVTFIPLALDFLMIPRQAFVFLFDYLIIKFTIYIYIRAVRCAIYVYNIFKL